MSRPARVRVYEVGPRDGLQNVPELVPTPVKIDFIRDLAAAGLSAIEVSSFVSPSWVPQLADADQVVRALEAREGLRLPVLVPNAKGLERALAAGARELAIFTAASEAFSRKNVNATIDESVERLRPVAEWARRDELWLRGYVSTAFGCPYQGPVPLEDLLRVVDRLFELGCDELSIGDTIGIAQPLQVAEVVEALAERFDLERLALHLHDTWGRGLANCLAGLEAGVAVFDSSAGGLGGCPYAPGATGNLATEDLVCLLDAMGIETGVDVARVAAASRRLAARTGLELPSRALAALGAVPPPASQPEA